MFYEVSEIHCLRDFIEKNGKILSNMDLVQCVSPRVAFFATGSGRISPWNDYEGVSKADGHQIGPRR